MAASFFFHFYLLLKFLFIVHIYKRRKSIESMEGCNYEDKYFDCFPGSKPYLRRSAVPKMYQHINARSKRAILRDYNCNVR